jgi:hypothetical protein
MKLKLKYKAVDGYSKAAQFATLKGAQDFAQHWLGKAPCLGSGYAVSNDGVGKLYMSGWGDDGNPVPMAALFPALSN